MSQLIITSNNQTLQSANDKDRRSNAVIFASFTRQMVKTRVIRFRGVEGPNACNQIAFCAFHSFLVEVQTNAGYIHVTHA